MEQYRDDNLLVRRRIEGQFEMNQIFGTPFQYLTNGMKETLHKSSGNHNRFHYVILNRPGDFKLNFSLTFDDSRFGNIKKKSSWILLLLWTTYIAHIVYSVLSLEIKMRHSDSLECKLYV